MNDSLTSQIWDNVSIKVNTKFMDDTYLYVEHANEPTKETFSANKRIQKCCFYKINTSKITFLYTIAMNNLKRTCRKQLCLW